MVKGDVASGRHVLMRVASVWRLCGVQIGDVRRNGRHVLDWAASRLWMWGGMDAMC